MRSACKNRTRFSKKVQGKERESTGRGYG
jgi:hypothetical protein